MFKRAHQHMTMLHNAHICMWVRVRVRLPAGCRLGIIWNAVYAVRTQCELSKASNYQTLKADPQSAFHSIDGIHVMRIVQKEFIERVFDGCSGVWLKQLKASCYVATVLLSALETLKRQDDAAIVAYLGI